ERILPQLREVEERLSGVRQKILKSKAVRAQLFGAGGATAEDEESPRGRARESRRSVREDAPTLTEDEARELDEELKDLKRRLKSDDRT
ncbi:MAG TPA: hypothetical protein VMX57_02710, partial [Planctomycetota bacterium]|nr:hypothetical protein [Planctomycetota bacterium]